MKVISLVTVANAMLISSNVPETDHPEWGTFTSYAAGDRAIRSATHRVYESLQGANAGNTPESSPLMWADLGPTNRWAMFDAEVGTQTTRTTPLTVELAPGMVNSLALLAVQARSVVVSVKSSASGPTVYSRTISMEASIVTDWYAYFFEPFDQLEELVLTDLPPHVGARVTVSLTANAGTSVSCGVLVLGTAYSLGDTTAGAQAGITDYSRKETDALGATTFVRRPYSKRMEANLRLAAGAMRATYRLLANLRATPCVWIGADGDDYSPLVVFGFYRDFSITVDYPTWCLCNLTIEGLI